MSKRKSSPPFGIAPDNAKFARHLDALAKAILGELEAAMADGRARAQAKIMQWVRDHGDGPHYRQAGERALAALETQFSKAGFKGQRAN